MTCKPIEYFESQIEWLWYWLILKATESEIIWASSLGSHLIWISNRLNLKSAAVQSNWEPNHLSFKSLESQITWISNHLNFKAVESQITWTSKHLNLKSCDFQSSRIPKQFNLKSINWLQSSWNQLTTKSLESQTNVMWNVKSLESQTHWSSKQLNLKPADFRTNWTPHLRPIGSLSLETLCGRSVIYIYIYMYVHKYDQRKFRNLTSDYTESCCWRSVNQEMWSRRCDTAEMWDMRIWRVGSARNAVFFHSFVASQVRKVRS